MMLKRIRTLLSRRRKEAGADADAGSPPDAPAPRIHRGPEVVSRPIDQSDLDPDAVKIIQRLTRFDHGAYLVGGCVRDLLLDLKPKDFDVGTSATPRQIKRLFRNCRIIGRRFRLAHIYFQNGKIIEVATFRAQNGDRAAPSDDADVMIRDDNQFGTPESDALRRDFTINALFYDVNNETVLDHAEGLQDLRRRLIRTIGEPTLRFREDPIRILRAIKFAARLDFSIESKTLKALEATSSEIPKAASPRVLEEINRFCRGGAARRSFELLRETGVYKIILPEIAAAYEDDDSAWSLQSALLETLDKRQRSGDEIATGAIFAALLLPALTRRLGWREDGTVDPPRGLNIREIADSIMRPLAVRLRVARKDQEHCRLTLLTLYRMVPVARLRRNSKRAILRRESLPDSLWILEALAGRLGAEFEEAWQFWRKAAATEAQPRERREESSAKSGSAGRRRRGGRRRGGRGGRGRAGRKTDGATTQRSRTSKDEQAKKVDRPKKAARPKKVDDDYFFSALPSVPDMQGEETPGDRYGAGSVAGGRTERKQDAVGEREATAVAEDREKPRRRRRRRRRKPAAEGGGTEGNSE